MVAIPLWQNIFSNPVLLRMLKSQRYVWINALIRSASDIVLLNKMCDRFCQVQDFLLLNNLDIQYDELYRTIKKQCPKTFLDQHRPHLK